MVEQSRGGAAPACTLYHCSLNWSCPVSAGVTGNGGAVDCSSSGGSRTGNDQGREDSWESHFAGWATRHWLV